MTAAPVIENGLLGDGVRILSCGLHHRLHGKLWKTAVPAGTRHGVATVQVVQAADHVGLWILRTEDVPEAPVAVGDGVAVRNEAALIDFSCGEKSALRDAADHCWVATDRTSGKVSAVINGVHREVSVTVGLTINDIIPTAGSIEGDV